MSSSDTKQVGHAAQPVEWAVCHSPTTMIAGDPRRGKTVITLAFSWQVLPTRASNDTTSEAGRARIARDGR